MFPTTGSPIFGVAETTCAERLIELAIAEDLGEVGDLTSLVTIPESGVGAAVFVARAPGVLSGLPVVAMLAKSFDLEDGFASFLEDGTPLRPGDAIARVSGATRRILAMERTALNFLQRLSGIATLTRRFVNAAESTNAAILDTRKTTPGWRMLEKYAVRCGGGQNHRIGLFDAVLIKDNHLAGLKGTEEPIVHAVSEAKKRATNAQFIEVEVDSLEQFDEALTTEADIILLDNFPSGNLVEAVRRRDAAGSRVLLEASGGVNLETVSQIARTGVDRISVGALTHSAPALDIALDEDLSQ